MQQARFLALAAAIGALALTMAEPASAQLSAEQQSALRANCRSDFMSKCSGVTPGGKEALGCLQKNVASLSSGCQAAVKAVRSDGAADPTPAATTSTDDDSASTDSSSGTTSQPAAQSSSQPDEAMPNVHLTLRQEIMLVRQSCGPDFRAYCSSVPLGGGNAVACLHRHRAQLSGNCKEALAAVLLQ